MPLQPQGSSQDPGAPSPHCTVHCRVDLTRARWDLPCSGRGRSRGGRPFVPARVWNVSVLLNKMGINSRSSAKGSLFRENLPMFNFS